MSSVIDLRGSDTGFEGLSEALGTLVSRLDPDHPLRKVIFPATFEERVQRTIEETTDPAIVAQARTKDVRRSAAEETAFPLEEEAEVRAEIGRAEGRQAVLSSAEAVRELEVLNQLSEMLPAQEAAQVRRLMILSEGAESELAIKENERSLAILTAAERLGLTAEAQAEFEVLSFEIAKLEAQLRRSGLELDQSGIEAYTEIWLNATGEERDLMAAGMAGPRGQAFAQDLISQRAFDRQVSLENLRSRLRMAQTPDEINEALFVRQQEVRKERDRVIEQLDGAIEAGEKDRIQIYVNDLRTLAQDMMRIDPSQAVAIADEVRGILFRNSVKDVKFDLTDITETRADSVAAHAALVNQRREAGDTDEQIFQWLEEATTTSAGRSNPRLVFAVMEQAERFRAEDARQRQLEIIEAARIETRGNRPQSETRRQLQAYEQELEEILGGVSREGPMGTTPLRPERASELIWEIRKLKLVDWFQRTSGAPIPGPLGGEVGPRELREQRERGGGER